MQFFSNRLGNAFHSHNSYEYEDEAYSDEARHRTGYNRDYGHGHSASYDNDYSNRYDDRYTDGSFYQDRQQYPPANVDAYAGGNRSQHPYYPNSTDPRYPINAHASAANKVTNITEAGHRVPEVLVIVPNSFEEIPYVVQALREYKSVLLNLASMSPDYTQRTIDFITGGTHAMDGNCERIGEGIFLFTPSCVRVSNQTNPV